VFTAIFLAIVLFIRERPGPGDIEPGSAQGPGAGQAAASPQSAGKPLAVTELLRMPIFWILSLSVAMSLSVLQTTVISIVPIAQDAGISVTKSATLLSVLGFMSLAGKGLLAVIGDWIDRVKALALTFCFLAFSCAALLMGNSYGILLFCAALQGLSAAAITPVFMALLADRFGAASFGTANGVAALIMSICGALTVRLGGEIFDRTGSYDAMFVTFIAISLAAAVLVLVSKRMPGGQVAAAPA
jgi:MFS family permease